ncbi:hypothetical protein ERIC2_c07090 [Paenibacillus larvae subsp. larvae DSM 25430]|uniref:Uncharacterized protein n=1 Tax=Paenibacillus larvae subsp. larvae DSM 25430 TaxID=697284 RepID=V9W318_9BACL|nr:hypothetical protein ERIC2_c07090 [Paenibacillus larvae subsp. larvae DSM 25430]
MSACLILVRLSAKSYIIPLLNCIWCFNRAIYRNTVRMKLFAAVLYGPIYTAHTDLILLRMSQRLPTKPYNEEMVM